MVGRYWGRRFSINRLREIANVDRNGASLRSLATAAESIGFTTRPVKASLDKLAEQSLPAIVHWEGKHYIVVYEVKRDRVIVADPAISQLSLTHAQFKAGWTGYTLLLQPTALFREVEETRTPVKVKSDAYPFQDCGIVKGSVSWISPDSKTLQKQEQTSPAAEIFELEIILDSTCI